MRNTLGIFALIVALPAQPLCALADETDTSVNESVAQVIKAVGGEEKLLDVFRFHERVLITSTPAPLVEGETNGNRTSVVKAGGGWWVGTNKRNKDKVRVLCWAWSLRILLDDKSKIEAIPDIVVDNKPAFGLRVIVTIGLRLNSGKSLLATRISGERYCPPVSSHETQNSTHRE